MTTTARVLASTISLFFLPGSVLATNGMNLEGYGPEALGMGGSSMAYDNGSAASMNNPSTIGLMEDGHRFDFAIGFLGPQVTSEFGGSKADSSADAYYMPALGWTSKKGPLAYGVGIFAQGGMGTEYGGTSFLSGYQDAATGNMASSGLTNRSEVSVGRFLIPISYVINDAFVVGGSIDYVWAGMDILMQMPGAVMMDMMPGGSQSAGTISGTLVDGLGGLMGSGGISGLNYGYFDFSDDSDFTGEASSTGFAAKLGGVYKINSQTTLGFTYHSQTSLGDLETGNATVTMSVLGDSGVLQGQAPSGTNVTADIPLTGTIKVKDFQWPSMYGLGVSFAASEQLQIAADLKRINWSQVMKDFTMEFTADNSPTNGGFGGASMTATLYQEWEDQTVIALGAAYKINDKLTGRVGYNYASNPIPDEYMNPLFPAIVESHLTLGAGYGLNPASDINFALSIAPENSQTNSQNNVKSSMSQMSWQLMYSLRY